MHAKLSPASVLWFTIFFTYSVFRDVQATFWCSPKDDQVTALTGRSVLISCTLERKLEGNEEFILEKRDKTMPVIIGVCLRNACDPSNLILSEVNQKLILIRLQNLTKNDSGQYYAYVKYAPSDFNKTLVLNLTVVSRIPRPTCETIFIENTREFELSCEWAIQRKKGKSSSLSFVGKNHKPVSSYYTSSNQANSVDYYKVGNRVNLMFSLNELVTSKTLPDACVVKTINENAEEESCNFVTPVLDLHFHEPFLCEHNNESASTVWVLNDSNMMKLNPSELSFIDISTFNENKTLIICGNEEYGKIYVNLIGRIIVSDESDKCYTVRVGEQDQGKTYSISAGCASTPANDHLPYGCSDGSTVGYTESTKVSTPVTQGTHAVQTSSATIDPNSDTDVSKYKESGILFFAVASMALLLSIGTCLYIVSRKLCTNRKASVPFHEHGGNYHRHSPTTEMRENEESIATPQITSQLSLPTTDIQLPLFSSDTDAVNLDNRSRQPRDRCPTLPPRFRPFSPKQLSSSECHLLPERNFSSNTLPCVKENTKGDFFPTGHHEEESTNRTKQNIDCAAVDEGSTDALTSFDNIYNTVDDIQNKLKSAAAVDILNKHDSNSPCLLLTASANPQDLSNAVDGNNLEERPTIRFQKASLPLASSEDIDRLYAKPKKNITLEQPSFFSTPTNTTPLRPGEDDNIEASSSPSDYEELRQSKP